MGQDGYDVLVHGPLVSPRVLGWEHGDDCIAGPMVLNVLVLTGEVLTSNAAVGEFKDDKEFHCILGASQ
eukprot:266717-Alexandrium_andersonii.AAC.1